MAVRFSGISDADDRRMYVLSVASGAVLPGAFRPGALTGEAEIAAASGRVVEPGNVTFGAQPDSYAYARWTPHRNLFRVPLD